MRRARHGRVTLLVPGRVLPLIFRGDVAQMGEHLVRNEGVGGSNPLISTIKWARPSATRACEPRQDRKVAAVSNSSGVPLFPWPLFVARVAG